MIETLNEKKKIIKKSVDYNEMSFDEEKSV